MMRFANSCRRAARLVPLAFGAGVVGLSALSLPVRAGMPPAPQVSGPVSAVQGTSAVRINGTTYLIAPNSPAAQTIRTVSAGETIGLVLNGPAGSSTSQVVYITHTARGGR